MVVMTVAEYNGVNSGQVNAEGFSIFNDRISLSRIKQEFVPFSLDVDTESVFCDTAFVCGTVIRYVQLTQK